eukprot:NODE_4319_length_591_cov_43.946494_g3123_i0.p3 GENE.NODE_4319_length_591_cov_43.946494_g3123_i0~~NODE_4319_length_591_cov_43.946494_g3123_i0.p3  ORF type:complete len:88 (+),score=2.45 NODE_4319_length_591_cov_43.946494_g3123_i0:326-589(+)
MFSYVCVFFAVYGTASVGMHAVLCVFVCGVVRRVPDTNVKPHYDSHVDLTARLFFSQVCARFFFLCLSGRSSLLKSVCHLLRLVARL